MREHTPRGDAEGRGTSTETGEDWDKGRQSKDPRPLL